MAPENPRLAPPGAGTVLTGEGWRWRGADAVLIIDPSRYWTLEMATKFRGSSHNNQYSEKAPTMAFFLFFLFFYMLGTLDRQLK